MNTAKLTALCACGEAVDWVKTQPSAKAAWTNCIRGDWMLWLLHCLSEPDSAMRKRVVLACCKCARISLKYVPKGENGPRRAIIITERWARGKATMDNVQASDAAGWAASASAASASAASDAAGWAADARAAAARAAATDARAADAAAAASSASAAAAASASAATDARAADASRAAVLNQCAKIVRRFFPTPPRF